MNRAELYKDDGGWILTCGNLSRAIEQLFKGEDNTNQYFAQAFPTLDAAVLRIPAYKPIHIRPANLSRQQWEKAKIDAKYLGTLAWSARRSAA